MSSFVRGVRKLATAASAAGKTKYKSCLLTSLNNREAVFTRHPLDTYVVDYHRVIKEIMIPTFMEVAPDIPGYGERIKELLEYNCPTFSDAWSFPVELAYRTVVSPDHRTPENIKKMRILRGTYDMLWTSTAMLDDVAANAETRNNKPAWHKICSGGYPSGLYDAHIVCFFIFNILELKFKGDPGYYPLVEMFLRSGMKMMIGEQIDVLGQCEGKAEWQPINLEYKPGHMASLQQPFGFLHAGITHMEIINLSRHINYRLGVLMQKSSDFNDYYCTKDTSGNPARDIRRGAGATWVSETARKHFTPAQEKLFKENFGQKDPEKVAKVKQLYDEVDMPSLYVEDMRTQYREIAGLISKVPHEKVQESLTSHLDWFIGDLKE